MTVNTPVHERSETVPAEPPELSESVGRARPQPLRTRIAAGVMAVLLLGGGGFAAGYTVAHAAGSSAVATAAPGGGTVAGGAGPGGTGTFGGAPVSGTITAVSATSVTVRAASGDSTTYPISGDTAIVNDGATASASDLAVGDPVVVFGAAGSAGSAGSAGAAERILAGTSATQAASGPGAAAGSAGAGDGAATGTTT